MTPVILPISSPRYLHLLDTSQPNNFRLANQRDDPNTSYHRAPCTSLDAGHLFDLIIRYPTFSCWPCNTPQTTEHSLFESSLDQYYSEYLYTSCLNKGCAPLYLCIPSEDTDRGVIPLPGHVVLILKAAHLCTGYPFIVSNYETFQQT